VAVIVGGAAAAGAAAFVVVFSHTKSTFFPSIIFLSSGNDR